MYILKVPCFHFVPESDFRHTVTLLITNCLADNQYNCFVLNKTKSNICVINIC